ncbi:type IV pilin N-terminal domain-containing protein [Methanorbis rubei]|uniref:Archaeal Type IV pilin N-terminal domain-containing protein n=1 Tax=Methanorbis rubei TaxID=3028300 RepID=A0AAE4MFQ5_9EURY|nr:hypothetical protein [Methanocorpusculaceae archaeon Cs1]
MYPVEVLPDVSNTMKPHRKDSAVSPVIAVLLILAITVACAGVTAAVSLGFADNLQSGKQVGLIVKPADSGGDVLVTIVSGKDVPELTKLEIIDGGAGNAKYQEVKHSDGMKIASFTAGSGYVAENVAFPGNRMVSYTTPVIVKGTFKDGTEVILLNTKLSFSNIIVSPIYGILNDFFVENYDGSVNVSLMDLFLYGQKLSFTHSQFHIIDNNGKEQHGLTITIPKGMLDENIFAKITISKIDKDGNTEVNTNTIGAISNNPSLTMYTVDKEKYENVVVQLDLYDKWDYQEYQKKYNAWKKSGKTEDEPEEPHTVGSQSGTITLTGKGY